MPGGLLDRLGRPPDEIEARSRGLARTMIDGRWRDDEADLAASLLYACGDPDLARDLRLAGDPVGAARRALAAGAPLLVDVGMVAAGVRLPAGRRLDVAVRRPGAAELARRAGVTRAAAGVRLAWDECGAGGVVAVGNAPTALLAVLDLAERCGPPACVVATCPGFSVAAEAKAALAASGLPHVAVAGTRGGSGLAAAAVNALLASPSPSSPSPPRGGRERGGQAP
jgi:precorrin-8X/cobalt-precorrin-8 methylmutase